MENEPSVAAGESAAPQLLGAEATNHACLPASQPVTAGPDRPKEACGVFGIAFHDNAAEITRLGLYSLQHRGQESAGMLLLREGKCELHKGMGLVPEVFGRQPREFWAAPQQMAVGHVRYSTAGGSSIVNAQPFTVEFDRWTLGLAHNGTISNGGELRRDLKRTGAIMQGTTDTELVLHLAARLHEVGAKPWMALSKALQYVEGAYSMIALCEDGMAVFRDPYGWRPLCMGRLGESYVFASETCALDMIGAVYERDIEPGEMLIVHADGEVETLMVTSAPRRAHCIFELVYFARPDSQVFKETVYAVRKRFGARLALESPVAADVVMPVPDGGIYAALGYAEAAGIPFDMGIMRNHYVGRTFIKPTAEDRRVSVQVKLNPIKEAIVGKRIVLVDDSIVRGNTSRERVRMLRECGAKEVHMRISCPPHVGPCYYGIDFPRAEELMANNHTLDEIANLINVDSLAYLTLEGMLACVQHNPAKSYCHACFSRQYPVPPKFGLAPEPVPSAPQQPRLFEN